MKQKTLFIGSVFAILFLAMMTACTTQPSPITPTPTNGRVVMTVTDAAANMGAISSIVVVINKVSLHSDAQGWVDVSTATQTYDLLELKRSETNALLADLSLAPARYDQIRLYVSSVTITDTSGNYDAKMPSNVLRLNGEIVVLANKTATVSLDFIADESVHKTGKGQYILAPVIQLESRTDGGADTSKSDNVRLFNGAVQTSSRVGMDSLGNLVIGGKLPPFLEINEDGTISGTENKLVPKNTSNAPPNPNDLNSRIAP